MQPFLLQSFSQPLLIICWGVPRKYTSSYHPLCEFLSISRYSKLFVGRERERFYSRSLPRCFICFFANYIRKIPTYPHVVISSLTFEVTTTTLQPPGPFILALCACISNTSSVQLLSVFTIKFQSFIKICVNNSEPL